MGKSRRKCWRRWVVIIHAYKQLVCRDRTPGLVWMLRQSGVPDWNRMAELEHPPPGPDPI